MPSSNSQYHKVIYGWDINSGDKTYRVDLDVVDRSHLYIGDSGESSDRFTIFQSSIEKPWKSISEHQFIQFTDAGDVLIDTKYPSNPYGYPNELCTLKEASFLECGNYFNPVIISSLKNLNLIQ